MEPGEAAEGFCHFLEKKQALLNRYLALTRKIKERLKGEDSSGTEGLVKERQACIRKIDKIDLAIKRLGREGPEKLLVTTDRFAYLIEGYLRRIKNTLESIAPVDRDVMMMAKKENEAIKAGILNMRNRRQAAQGYANYGQASPRFLDVKR